MTGRELEKVSGLMIDVFFKAYYEVTDEEKLSKLRKCSHQELKAKARSYGYELESVWSEEVVPEEIQRGDVLVVTDAFHHNGLYVNPRRSVLYCIPEETSFVDSYTEPTEEEYEAINNYYEAIQTRELCQQYADMIKPKTYTFKKGE